MFWLRIFIILFSFGFVFSLQRAYGEGHGEQNEENSGHGGGEAKKTNPKMSGSQDSEWLEAQKNLQHVKQKVMLEEKKLSDLKAAIKSNNKMTDAEYKEVKETEKKLKELSEEYEKVSNYYSNRFPERGLNPGRTYKRNDFSEGSHDSTVDEKPQTLESKVVKIKQKIKNQYKLSTNSAGAVISKSTIVSSTAEKKEIEDPILKSPKLEK